MGCFSRLSHDADLVIIKSKNTIYLLNRYLENTMKIITFGDITAILPKI